MILSLTILLSLGTISSLSVEQNAFSCPKDMQISEDGTYCTDLKTDESADYGTIPTTLEYCTSNTDCPLLNPMVKCCSGKCVNTYLDDYNCGICGWVCQGGKRCLGGNCEYIA